MPPLVAAAIAIAPVAAVAVRAYAVTESRSQTKSVKSEAKKVRLQQKREFDQVFQRDLEAGEYFEELSTKQMELQAQAANIRTLADLIASQRQTEPETRIFTLPAQKTQTPIQQINLAIDKLLRG